MDSRRRGRPLGSTKKHKLPRKKSFTEDKDKNSNREARNLVTEKNIVVIQSNDHNDDNKSPNEIVDSTIRHRPRPLDTEKQLKIILPNDKSKLAVELSIYCADPEDTSSKLVTNQNRKKNKSKPIIGKNNRIIDIPPFEEITSYVKESLLNKKVTESEKFPQRAKGKESGPFIKNRLDIQIGTTYEMDDDDETFITSLSKDSNWLNFQLFETMIEQLERESYLGQHLVQKHRDFKVSSVKLETLNNKMIKIFKKIENGPSEEEEDDEEEVEDNIRCSICLDKDSEVLLVCDECGITVHSNCYYETRNDLNNLSEWLCKRCIEENETGEKVSRSCIFCPNKGGAILNVKEDENKMNESDDDEEEEEDNTNRYPSRNRNPLKSWHQTYDERDTNEKEWAHILCALNIKELTLTPQGILGIENVSAKRYRSQCILCGQNGRSIGACGDCPIDDCKEKFHATCAIASNCNVNNKRIYCPSHSTTFDHTAQAISQEESLRLAVPLSKASHLLNLVISSSSNSKPKNKEKIINEIYEYWIKKRLEDMLPLLRCFHTFPLLENWLLEYAMPDSIEKVDIEESERNLKILSVRRRELEKSRLLSDMVRRREKLKRERASSLTSIVDQYLDLILEENFTEARHMNMNKLSFSNYENQDEIEEKKVHEEIYPNQIEIVKIGKSHKKRKRQDSESNDDDDDDDDRDQKKKKSKKDEEKRYKKKEK